MRQPIDAPQKFTLALADSTYRRLKYRAIDERRSMTAIIRDAVLNYLDLAEASSSNGDRSRA